MAIIGRHPREFHVGDIILICGAVKKVSRVDQTHLGTYQGDKLELWSYEGEVHHIFYEDYAELEWLGFEKSSENSIILKWGNNSWIEWYEGGEFEFYHQGRSHDGDSIFTLGDLQQEFFNWYKEEIPFHASL